MKKLILFLLIAVSFSISAQDNFNSPTMDDQTDLWMNKISSDSDLRIKMINMMVEKTKDNIEEMNKLANSISDSPGLFAILKRKITRKAGNENISVEPRGTINEANHKDTSFITKPVIVPKK